MTLSSDLRRIADQIDWEVACGETAFVSENATTIRRAAEALEWKPVESDGDLDWDGAYLVPHGTKRVFVMNATRAHISHRLELPLPLPPSPERARE